MKGPARRSPEGRPITSPGRPAPEVHRRAVVLWKRAGGHEQYGDAGRHHAPCDARPQKIGTFLECGCRALPALPRSRLSGPPVSLLDTHGAKDTPVPVQRSVTGVNLDVRGDSVDVREAR